MHAWTRRVTWARRRNRSAEALWPLFDYRVNLFLSQFAWSSLILYPSLVTYFAYFVHSSPYNVLLFLLTPQVIILLNCKYFLTQSFVWGSIGSSKPAGFGIVKKLRSPHSSLTEWYARQTTRRLGGGWPISIERLPCSVSACYRQYPLNEDNEGFEVAVFGIVDFLFSSVCPPHDP